MKEVPAFFVSAIPAAIIGAAVSGVTGAFPRPTSIFVLHLLLLYSMQAIIGLPVRGFLLRTGRRSLASFGLGGALMVAIIAVPYVTWGTVRNDYAIAYSLTVLAMWIAYGAITGSTYWFLIRPDQVRSQA